MKPIFYCFLILLLSCNNQPIKTHDILQQVSLQTQDTLLKQVFTNKDSLKLQIKLTVVNNTSEPLFTSYNYNVNDSLYFYPASTVKLPVALLALEEINYLPFTSDTPYFIEGDSLISTIKKDITAVFALSDNAAYNRLYEFLGSDKINTQLTYKGLAPSRVVHRLSVEDAEERALKSVIFFKNDSVLHATKEYSDAPIPKLKLKDIVTGKGYFEDTTYIEEPMSFEYKNFYPISKQHETLIKLFYPDVYKYSQQFHLNKSDNQFIKEMMSSTPKSLGYSEELYPDNYVKFFHSANKASSKIKKITIYNKAGFAYGYLTDNAYIVDSENNIAFFLTATLLVNQNKIFNDDTYQYDTIGIPFLSALAKEIHQVLRNKQQH